MLTVSKLTVKDGSSNNRVYRWRERVRGLPTAVPLAVDPISARQALFRWKQLQIRAKREHIPFSITPGQVESMLTTAISCPILGIPLQRRTKKANDGAAEFDRFYPKLGYVPGNVHVISRRANRMKTDAAPDEILRLAGWILQTARQ